MVTEPWGKRIEEDRSRSGARNPCERWSDRRHPVPAMRLSTLTQLDRVIEESGMGAWTETLPYLRPES